MYEVVSKHGTAFLEHNPILELGKYFHERTTKLPAKLITRKTCLRNIFQI